ncbi:LOW QUALITY PROTEIN: tRNA A64-2'-O-ribosylphosphate transferase-like [Brachypodium distachyon]|nr:LOW QUALITY PROTEIN: tRNA A64-2'-O-ribosylphosphate transferase-like [Brachypodium distachyon]|eukprot:XP_014755581.1 LOW QUALITY PROTEIN: tRNA A64-2'-O-ribosylphosphate transferase-like [Brachypodium distachyon]
MAAAAAEAEPAAEEATLSIYKAARRIKRRGSTLYNALRSVAEDAAFVAEIAALWPALPLVANLRCGLWYTHPRSLAATCYFKSTDGHAGNWSFSTARLNLHLALLAGERGGCIIVDSTRKGKRFPDSMSKTIPIWCSVLNRAIQRHRLRASNQGSRTNSEMSAAAPNGHGEKNSGSSNWDSSVHLPVWVLDTEKNAIEGRIEEWTDRFESCGADIHSLALGLHKPLRPLWVSQNTRIWLNEVPEHELWEFTPVILVSASASCAVATQRMSSEFSWHYIPGAGDDEESWARGLTPALFWKHSYDLLDGGPDLCNQLVSDIVEKDRVYRSQRGEHSPQITVNHLKCLGDDGPYFYDEHTIITKPMNLDPSTITPIDTPCSNNSHLVFWIGTSNLAVSSTIQVADDLADVDCILNCDSTSRLPSSSSENSYLEIAIVGSKNDRFSLLKNLPKAINFAQRNLIARRKILLCCQTGEDISICVALAIITRLFNDSGCFDDGDYFVKRDITKLEMRKRLVFICKYAINARPSRGNLRQVYGFLCNEKAQLCC